MYVGRIIAKDNVYVIEINHYNNTTTIVECTTFLSYRKIE